MSKAFIEGCMSFLMMDLASLVMTEEEGIDLQHASVGGVILFSRNFENKSQLQGLIKQIRDVNPSLLIAVDQEGGRVQRFREGFTTIPAMGDILPAAKNDLSLASLWAKELGFLMAIELLSCDIDLSFAPVLDLNLVSHVIGKRSFSPKPEEVYTLAFHFIHGMNEAGMMAVGKHFPGHGSVVEDSHIAMPVDHRTEAEIRANDMQPFIKLITENKLNGIMPAHVIYDEVDKFPAGFSQYWLQQVLRQELSFDGVIFSDDLGMKGASAAGDYCDRAKAALAAGCNMILVCNDPEGVKTLLSNFSWHVDPCEPLASSLKPNLKNLALALEQTERWQSAAKIAEMINTAVMTK